MAVSARVSRVPAIPDPHDAPVDRVLSALKEWVEVRQGTRGDGLDGSVTLRDLMTLGLLTEAQARALVARKRG